MAASFQPRVFSEAEAADIRRMFEKEGASLAAISRHIGVAPATLAKRIKLWRLKRRKPAAVRAQMARTSAAPAEKPDLSRTARRLEQRLAQEITRVEAKLDGGTPLDREARTLASLVKSLAEIRRFAAGPSDSTADRNAELEELRAELARRIDRLSGATGEAGSAAAPAGEAAG